MGDEEHSSIMHDLLWWQYILLAIILVSGYLLVHDVHASYTGSYIDPHSSQFIIDGQDVSYTYPLHADEWTHLAQAQYMMSSHGMANVNPYIQQSTHRDLESGFHSFLAAFFTSTGLDPITTYQYLPAIFMVITMLSLFLMLIVIIKNYWIALLSTLFLLFVKSNINLMGSWFFLPMIFALFLMFMFFAAYFSKGPIRYLAILFYLATIFSYPTMTIIITMIVILYEIVNAILHQDKTLFSLRYVKYYIIIIVALFTALMIFFKGRLSAIPFIVKYGWTIYFEQTYTPMQMYGWIPTILAIIGIAYVIIKRKNLLMIAAPVVFIVPMIMYSLFRFTILIPYQRAFFYFLISLVPLSAIGIYYIYNLFYSLFRSLFDIKSLVRFISISIVVILLLLTSILGFRSYYKIDDNRFLLVHYATDTDYQAMQWIKQNYGKDTVIMADIFTAFATYPLTGMQTVAVAPSNLEGGNMSVTQNFYFGSGTDCNSRQGILTKYHVKLVYSYDVINCNFLKEVYNKGVNVYEVI